MTRAGRFPCVLLVAAVVAAAGLTSCSPVNDRAILATLQAQLADQYHGCVPLGWIPVAAAGTYYPGTSVIFSEEGVWLPARWIARVRTRDLARADVRSAARVLNELARVGMVERTDIPGGFRYHLATAALPFYYDENDRGNNPDHIPYLCYSTIVPRSVESTDAVRRGRLRYGSHNDDMFHATFEWTPSTGAAWSNDAFIRAHSVHLGPAESPVTATLVNRQGEWTVAELSSPTPPGRIVDVAAWPKPGL